jgi:hypothetical protein
MGKTLAELNLRWLTVAMVLAIGKDLFAVMA